MEPEAASRLGQKATREAIIGRIADDLHMAPFLARAYFEQMAGYFQQYAGHVLQDNQVRYCAIAAEEPAGLVVGGRTHAPATGQVDCNVREDNAAWPCSPPPAGV